MGVGKHKKKVYITGLGLATEQSQMRANTGRAQNHTFITQRRREWPGIKAC